MKRICVLLLGVLSALPAFAGHNGDGVKEQLIKLERQSWEAWQKHDGKFFARFLAEDHAEVGAAGPTDKAGVVAFVAGGTCKVESYNIDQFHVQRVSADTVLLIYHARQATTCGGAPVPSPVWVSSLYARRHGRWVNVLFQQSPAAA